MLWNLRLSRSFYLSIFKFKSNAMSNQRNDTIQSGYQRVNDDAGTEDETTGLITPPAQSSYPQIKSDYNSVQNGSGEYDPVEIEISSAGPPTQNSLVTIFSMWNTMMGTSLLSMPWAIKQAGFVNGIILLIIMAGVMAYTSYRVLNSGRSIVTEVVSEFSDAVRIYLGRISEAIALLCSLLALLGGAIVYWILMSNFLYHMVMFVYHKVHDETPPQNGTDNYTFFYHSENIVPYYSNVVCNNVSESTKGLSHTFKTMWNETLTVPLLLIVLLFPLFNFKSPTFFTKFNAFGTVSVIYLMIFASVKASKWGINIDMRSSHSNSLSYSPSFSWTFPALTGVAALAYFLQNAVMAIVRNQKHPENNTRDLFIAYALVCFTYTFMGAIFYASFPLQKSCIEDNLLNNLASEDLMAFIARTFLFFQMTCVLPLLLYVLRAQLLHFIFGRVWPGRLHVLVLNGIVVAVCVLFAIVMPNIGHIISFVGAFCGFSYAIALPCAVFIVACYKDGTLTWLKLIIHTILTILGFANFIGQFVIIGKTT